MIFLPIVSRELLVASRRRGTYWLRVVAAVLALIFCGITLVTLAVMPSFRAAGERMFGFLSWVGLAFALLIGVQATADCLSREKREGTLGLLFLTDLKGFDVVFGKLAAAALTVFYGIVAMLPVLALPLILGGVTPGEYARVALVWLNSLFFAVSIGMAVSALSRDERIALGYSFAILLGVTLALPLGGMLLAERTGNPALAAPCASASPITACHLAFEASFKMNAKGYWSSLAITHVLSWALLGLACRFAGTTWGDKTAKRPSPSAKPPRPAGNAPARVIRRPRARDGSPVVWLLTRDSRVRSYPWILLATMLAVWGWGRSIERGMLSLQTTITLGFATNFLFKWWVATVACRSFAAERENGSLELLLSTPLRVAEMLHGTVRASRWLFGWPVAVVVVLQVAMIPSGLNRDYTFGNSGELIFMLFANVGVFLLDCWALHWVGLRAGFYSRQPQTAIWKTLFKVLALPWLGVWAMTALMVRQSNRDEELVLIWTWVLASVATDLFCGLRAKHRLRRDLRTMALGRVADGRAVAS